MATVPSGSKGERFQFISEQGATFGVRYLCDWLDVSPAGFYKWRDRSESDRVKANRELSDKIEEIFLDNHGNYGSPRVYMALRNAGEQVNHKRVERIMRETGLVGKAGRLYRRKPAPARGFLKKPNLRVNEPAPTGINQQWVGDITYLRVSGEWRYLAVVMDLYSRRIIGWSLGAQKSAELTHSALMKALRNRHVEEGLLFHTDRGSEYGANLIQDALLKAGIKSSMNRPESMTDNIHMESFFQTMKTECYHGLSFDSENQLRMALSDYLDDYYNTTRIHTSIGNTSPILYEALMALKN